MTPTTKQPQPNRQLAAMRARKRLVQRRTAAGALTLFVGVWGVLYAQLATGQSATASRTTTTASATASKASTSSSAITTTSATTATPSTTTQATTTTTPATTTTPVQTTTS